MRMASPMLKEAWTIRGDRAVGRMWRAITRASLAPRGDPKTCWKTSGPRPPGIGWPSRRVRSLAAEAAGRIAGISLLVAVLSAPAVGSGVGRARCHTIPMAGIISSRSSAPYAGVEGGTEHGSGEQRRRGLWSPGGGGLPPAGRAGQGVQGGNKGSAALVRGVAATSKPDSPLAETREILYGEAELTTGAVIARLPELIRLRFAIVPGKEGLARGETGG